MDNFLNGGYDLLHGYVLELGVIFVDGDNFFTPKCGYSSMFAVQGHASWVRLASCCSNPFCSIPSLLPSGGMIRSEDL